MFTIDQLTLRIVPTRGVVLIRGAWEGWFRYGIGVGFRPSTNNNNGGETEEEEGGGAHCLVVCGVMVCGVIVCVRCNCVYLNTLCV